MDYPEKSNSYGKAPISGVINPKMDSKNLHAGYLGDIWIVDDDNLMNYITRRIIHSVVPGISVLEFLSAKMALEKLRLDKFIPALVLLDINMPGISGWDFLDELNRQNQLLQVFMYSSSIDPDDMKKAESYGIVRGFIEKPIDAGIVQQILGYLGRRNVS